MILVVCATLKGTPPLLLLSFFYFHFTSFFPVPFLVPFWTVSSLGSQPCPRMIDYFQPDMFLPDMWARTSPRRHFRHLFAVPIWFGHSDLLEM